VKIYDCKCTKCKAEFQAALEDSSEEVKCPSCESKKVTCTETEFEAGCGGGCGGCGGGCDTK